MSRLDYETLRFARKCMEIGYEPKTTFWSDFTIAEAFGEHAVEDTYKRARKEWMDDVDYMAELTLVLNWKIWDLYEDKRTEALARLYNELWMDCEYTCYGHFEGADLRKYLDVID